MSAALIALVLALAAAAPIAPAAVPVAPAAVPVAADDFAAAVAAYRERDYAAALEGFERLAAAEPDPTRRAILHANAGTAAARAGAARRGEAVWHLMLARRLEPSDEVARRNLKRLAALAGASGPVAPGTAGNGGTRDLGATLRDLPLALTTGRTLQLAAALAGLGLLLAAGWRLRERGAPGRRLLGWSALLLVTLPPAALAWSAAVRAEAARQAVVLGEAVPLRSEPQDDGRIQFRLDGGSLVRAEDVRPGWRLVETAEGARGWLPGDRLRLIDPSAPTASE